MYNSITLAVRDRQTLFLPSRAFSFARVKRVKRERNHFPVIGVDSWWLVHARGGADVREQQEQLDHDIKLNRQVQWREWLHAIFARHHKGNASAYANVKWGCAHMATFYAPLSQDAARGLLISHEREG